jgi:putative PEP-CTERM system histidine kinase
VLHSATILGGGLYLLFMAGAGYYLREYGGDWGRVGQVVFFSLAIILLAGILLSGQMRAQLRMFLGKHFYASKYDYRQEWVQLTDGLSRATQGERRFKTAIEILANMVEARSGMLWLCNAEGDQYRNVASWGMAETETLEPTSSSFIQFLQQTGYLINLNEYDSHAEEYENLVLPTWLDEVQQPWLIVPLSGLHTLTGFIVLASPLLENEINWEDRGLLKTAARQISSHLTMLTTSDELAEAKQFEVFSRLSAYMVHDLKNIASELDMVARNAGRHMANPEFLQDAFATVDHAAGDINRLLEQLRSRRANKEKKINVDLCELVESVIASKQAQLPHPVLTASGTNLLATVEKNQLSNVVAHLIDNAQQATDDDGRVTLSINTIDDMHVIEISDNGAGMNADFIKNRLFKPFDTTKGNAGMGIGMYESREFMRRLGGEITVHSKAGQGSTICLHVPSSSVNSAQEQSHAY